MITYALVQLLVRNKNTSLCSHLALKQLSHTVIFFFILRTFPLTALSHIFSHSPFLPTVSYTFYTSSKTQHVANPASFLPRGTIANVYTWSTQLRFDLNLACSTLSFSSFSSIVPTLPFENLTECLSTVLSIANPMQLPVSALSPLFKKDCYYCFSPPLGFVLVSSDLTIADNHHGNHSSFPMLQKSHL